MDLKEQVAIVGEAWADSPYYADAEQWTFVFWEPGRPFRTLFDRMDLTRVVEVACGHGRHAEVCAPLCGELVLNDIHSANLDACRTRLSGRSNVSFVLGNGFDLRPVESATAIYCYDAMVHFSPDLVQSYLHEARRILKPGGMALFHHSNYLAPLDRHYGQNPHARNHMSLELFAQMAARAGLEVVEQLALDWGGEVDLDGLTLLAAPGEERRHSAPTAQDGPETPFPAADLGDPSYAFQEDGPPEGSMLAPPAGDDSVRKFLIVGMPRTGSTLIQTTLDQHPKVAAHGELFHWVQTEREGPHAIQTQDGARAFAPDQDDPIAFLSSAVWGTDATGLGAVGFKLFGQYVRADGTHNLFRQLKSAWPELSVIRIRRNLLEAFVSWRMAKQTGEWVRRPGNELPAPPGPLSVSPAELEEFFELHRATDAFFDEWLADMRHLTVDYADLTENFAAVSERIFEFLGVDAIQVRPAIAKQLDRSPRELLENWEALRAHFRGSAYEPLFA